MLLNTGTQIVPSKAGLLTTVCYQLGASDAVYALEGSVAVTGSAVQWLRDQLGIIKAAADIEPLALTVEDTGGAYFVPAFSGLFAPYWRSDARGAIVGLSRFHTRAHLARATLEAICFQTRAVLDAMVADSGVQLELLKVDGGATVNDTLMQLQADILGVPVVRPVVAETTALGAAYAAGLASGFWKDLAALRQNWKPTASGTRGRPQTSASRAMPGGRRPSSGRSIGWTSADDLNSTCRFNGSWVHGFMRLGSEFVRVRFKARRATRQGALNCELQNRTWNRTLNQLNPAS